MAKRCQQVEYAGGLLHQIASSLMLCQHLSVCGGCLSPPSKSAKHLRQYLNYTAFPHDGCLDPPGDDSESAIETSSEALADVYLTWVRLQVSYWLGVSTTSRAFGAPVMASSALPSISLIAMRYPDGPCEVEPWQDTVNDLFRQTPAYYNAKQVVDVVTSIANQPEKPDQHHVFNLWKAITNGKNITTKCAIHWGGTGIACKILSWTTNWPIQR